MWDASNHSKALIVAASQRTALLFMLSLTIYPLCRLCIILHLFIFFFPKPVPLEVFLVFSGNLISRDSMHIIVSVP
jgi:hypothetical protein